ncbi:MAG: hypothetical protein HY721_13510 [Planctomycetes bacterium]|nr:hypothetical protein [Planctomycetota bacterium]
MRTRLLAMAAAVFLAGCATSDGTRPGTPADEALPPPLEGPDLTAWVAIGGVT